MSFKCSIFGHKYGDSEVEREREEDGSEVVITVRETETCERCGETRIVSENKEVTTLETAADIVAEDLEGTDENDGAREEPATPTHEEPTDQPAPATEPEYGTEPADPTPQPTDQPPHATGHESEEPTIPEAESGNAVESPTDPAEDDGVILGEDEEDDEDDREHGEWPEQPDEDEDDWKPETDIDPQPESERRNVESTGNAVTVPDGEFQCPECGFTTSVESSSLREGDFCPECHQGALEHESD
jgi:predicted RNA-binding Zn-ribbon protein involved in translation (DUF1610 family)